MFDELADGVFRRRYASLDLNVGVVLSELGVLVVDTRASHVEADELKEELRSLTPLPVRWVVDTHWHWDHTFGNARFGEAEIWGHELCRSGMIEHGEGMKLDAARWLPESAVDFEEVVVTPPTSVFADAASIDMGSKLVRLSYHGLGHTDSDVAVHVDGHDVTFLGDLVEQGSPPVFDDSFPLSWPATLGSILGQRPGVVVPGHGDTMDRAALESQLEELGQVAALARRCMTEALPVADAALMGPYPESFMLPALNRAISTGR